MQTNIIPQARGKFTAGNKITEIELEASFVTTIRLLEPVNSVVVGDPALFQVERSEQEPELVFVKALTDEQAESNLLISPTKEHQISFLLVSGGDAQKSVQVDFLLQYQPARGFVLEPDAVPFALVAQTANISKMPTAGPSPSPASSATAPISVHADPDSRDELLDARTMPRYRSFMANGRTATR